MPFPWLMLLESTLVVLPCVWENMGEAETEVTEPLPYTQLSNSSLRLEWDIQREKMDIYSRRRGANRTQPLPLCLHVVPFAFFRKERICISNSAVMSCNWLGGNGWLLFCLNRYIGYWVVYMKLIQMYGMHKTRWRTNALQNKWCFNAQQKLS